MKQSVCKPPLYCAGKTTLLRDVARQLADKYRKLVLVVDPSEEIAGGGNIPHACIGSARRMMGSMQQSKYELLQEAVANHGPEVYLFAAATLSLLKFLCCQCSPAVLTE